MNKNRSSRRGTSGSLRISSRVVSTKRHTIGYVIGGRRYSVSQSVDMARRGRLSGVRVVGNHIQAENGRAKLSNLPMRVES